MGANKRRLWTAFCAACVALTLIFAFMVDAKKAQTEPDNRPNIVFVMTNDQSPNSVNHMPYLRDHMRPNATTFPNATFTFPLCCPSRVSMLRGQYPHNHGIWENQDAYDGGYEAVLRRNLQASTFPTWLAQAGYHNGAFGIYVNEFNRYTHGNPKGFHFYRQQTERYDGSPIPFGPERDVAVKDNALTWLGHNLDAAHDKPVFAWVSFFQPHHPYPHEARYANTFSTTPMPRNGSYDEADVSDKPAHVQAMDRITPAEDAALEEDYRDRLLRR